MADNLTTNPGAGGATIATDDIGGVHYPISKLAYGALDSATLVSAANGMPVSAASLPLPTGASTEATLAALSAKMREQDEDDIEMLLIA